MQINRVLLIAEVQVQHADPLLTVALCFFVDVFDTFFCEYFQFLSFLNGCVPDNQLIVVCQHRVNLLSHLQFELFCFISIVIQILYPIESMSGLIVNLILNLRTFITLLEIETRWFLINYHQLLHICLIVLSLLTLKILLFNLLNIRKIRLQALRVPHSILVACSLLRNCCFPVKFMRLTRVVTMVLYVNLIQFDFTKIYSIFAVTYIDYERMTAHMTLL